VVTQQAPVHSSSVTNGSSFDGDEESVPSVRITEQDLLQLFKSILTHISTRTSTKRSVLTAMLKLTAHMPSSQNELREIIAQYETHINVELQQRATEYEKILEIPSLPNKLLMRIPAPEVKAMLFAVEEPKKAPRPSAKAPVSKSTTAAPSAAPTAPAQPVNLLDMDLLQLTPQMPAGGAQIRSQVLPMPQPDLLDLLGGPTTSSGSPAPQTMMNDVLGMAPPASPSPPFGASGNGSVTSWPGIHVFNTADGVHVSFDISKPQPSSPQFTLVNVTYTNRGSQNITDVDLKVSLPNYLKLQILPISSTSLSPSNGTATQQIKLANTTTNRVRMRLRLEYKVNGEAKAELGEPQIPEAV
jgi:AP-1 complex subunit gamma-1